MVTKKLQCFACDRSGTKDELGATKTKNGLIICSECKSISELKPGPKICYCCGLISRRVTNFTLIELSNGEMMPICSQCLAKKDKP